MKKIKVLLFLTGIAGPFLHQSYAAQSVVSSTVDDLRVKTFEALGKDTVTLSFGKGSSEITEGDRKDLNAVVTAVRNSAVISSAIVAGWADRDYPAQKAEQLSKAERDLAEARIAKVKLALGDLGVKTIETHTMAEHPTWLGRFLNTEDTKLKGEGKIKDAKDRVTAAVGRILRERGGPGKVVVIVRREGEASSH